MEGLATTAPDPGRRRDLVLLALLLLLATGIHACVVRSTEVPARDSIGFIRYALWFEEHGWTWTLQHQHQHPGYPLTILGMSLPVRHWVSDDCESMQLSAQLASSLAGLLLVIPMYYLGKSLFDRSVGFWGALLFQCLPASGRALSDAISDPLFLLLLAASLAAAVRALAERSPGRFALAGAFCGLAYLTRPEGALVLPAAGLGLLLAQCVPAWRQSWRRALACGGALGLGALVAGSPYYLTVRAFTIKPSVLVVVTGKPPEAPKEEPRPQQDHATPSAPRPPAAAAVVPGPGPQVGTADDVKDWARKPLGWRMGRAANVLVAEFVQCYQYFGWLPALVGLWWCWARYRTAPEVWVVMALFWLDALLLWLLVVRAGYVSGRHVMVLVLCSIFQVVAVVRDLPYRLAAWRRGQAERPPGGRPLWLSPAVWSLLLLLLWSGTGLSRTLQPLHGNRTGHRAAGRWLAEHTQPWDQIDDDHCWAHYYAHRVFLEEQPIPQPAGYQPRHYVVVNRSNSKTSSTRSPGQDEGKLRRQGGQVVYHWPESGAVERARVLVYRLP